MTHWLTQSLTRAGLTCFKIVGLISKNYRLRDDDTLRFPNGHIISISISHISVTSTIVNFHPFSSIFIHFHPFSSIFIHFHPFVWHGMDPIKMQSIQNRSSSMVKYTTWLQTKIHVRVIFLWNCSPPNMFKHVQGAGHRDRPFYCCCWTFPLGVIHKLRNHFWGSPLPM